MNDIFFSIPSSNELDVTPISKQKRRVESSKHNSDVMDIDAQDDTPVFFSMDCGNDFLDLLSTHFLICNEKIPTKGEDCGFEAYTTEAGIMGAFDGCGGLGAKTCAAISNKTEAYLASRSVGNAVKMWFKDNSASGYDWNSDTLKKLIISNLSVCQKQSGEQGLKLKGTMVRPFPSTIAMVAFRIVNGELCSEHIWAGDSRTYVMDRNGLGQISTDDIKGEDAMSNLTKDGALTNVLSADGQFALHQKPFKLTEPCIVLAASDGCFGYVSSPMEFEFMILSTLVQAMNVDEWQRTLNDEIASRSGDDQTIAIAAFGFDEFSEMRDYYKWRFKEVLEIVRKFDSADSEDGLLLWESYKPNYYRYVTRGE